MNNIPFLFFYILLFASCSNSPKGSTGAVKKIYDNPGHKKPGSSYPDTVLVNFPAAVFFSPDSLQGIKLNAITGAKIFESIKHEYFYQAKNSMIVLKKQYPFVKIIELKHARYILFKKNSGEQSFLVDLDTKNDPYGLFIYDGKKAPLLLDMTNIDSELAFYFNK